jgi:hypothetical protein
MRAARKKRGGWAGWIEAVTAEYGPPALVATCGGMRVLAVSRGTPVRVLLRSVPAARQEGAEYALDASGVYLLNTPVSGWPTAGSYVDGFEAQCQIHEGHPVDAARLTAEWQRVDQSRHGARTVRLADLEPRRSGNL